MNLTLREIAPMIKSLNNVMSLPLPAKESYRLGVAAKVISERLEIYEKARQNLIIKFGEKAMDNGKEVIRVTDANMNAYAQEIEGLVSETVEINMKPIPLSLLGDSKVNAIDMINLSPFFVDDESAGENKEPQPFTKTG